MMTPLRILITGINGLIGGVLQKGLVGRYDVYGLDESEPFSDRVLSADISDYKQVAQAFETLRPLHVIHLAGNPSTEASWEEVLSTNIVGTRNIFEAAREFRVSRVIYASSNHVTGGYEGIESNYFLHRQTEPVKISTRDPVRPDSDYGVSKAFGEAVARYYCARWGVEAICLRIGAGSRMRIPPPMPATCGSGSAIATWSSWWKKVCRPTCLLGFTMGFPTTKVPSMI